MCVCRDMYISLALIAVGDAPSDLKVETTSGLTGTRILSPLKSAGALIACVLVVVCRKPLSNIRANR